MEIVILAQAFGYTKTSLVIAIPDLAMMNLIRIHQEEKVMKTIDNR